MFDPKDEITEAVEAVYAIAAGLKRGEILTHEAIRGVLGVEPHEGAWDHVVNRVRRKLENDRGIATWPAIGVGYRLLTVAETNNDLPIWRTKRAYRQIRRGRRSVVALPDKELTAHQRRHKAFLIDQAKQAESALRRDMKAQRLQLKPTGLNLRRAAAAPAPKPRDTARP